MCVFFFNFNLSRLLLALSHSTQFSLSSSRVSVCMCVSVVMPCRCVFFVFRQCSLLQHPPPGALPNRLSAVCSVSCTEPPIDSSPSPLLHSLPITAHCGWVRFHFGGNAYARFEFSSYRRTPPPARLAFPASSLWGSNRLARGRKGIHFRVVSQDARPTLCRRPFTKVTITKWERLMKIVFRMGRSVVCCV